MKKHLSEQLPGDQTPEAKDPFEGLTPSQKMKLRKEMKAAEEIAKLKNAS